MDIFNLTISEYAEYQKLLNLEPNYRTEYTEIRLEILLNKIGV